MWRASKRAWVGRVLTGMVGGMLLLSASMKFVGGEQFDEGIAEGRLDLTSQTVLTIDPVDARDFDECLHPSRRLGAFQAHGDLKRAAAEDRKRVAGIHRHRRERHRVHGLVLVPEAALRLFREVQATSRVRHPNVVEILDFGDRLEALEREINVRKVLEEGPEG